MAQSFDIPVHIPPLRGGAVLCGNHVRRSFLGRLGAQLERLETTALSVQDGHACGHDHAAGSGDRQLHP